MYPHQIDNELKAQQFFEATVAIRANESESKSLLPCFRHH